MPSLQSIQVTDRATTPVNFTLLPVSQKDGVAKVALADASGNVLSEKSLTLSTRRTAGRLRSSLRFAVPIIVNETINGVSVPRVARVGYVDCTFSFAIDSSEQERNDVVGMFASALQTSKVLVHDTVVKAQAVW